MFLLNEYAILSNVMNEIDFSLNSVYQGSYGIRNATTRFTNPPSLIDGVSLSCAKGVYARYDGLLTKYRNTADEGMGKSAEIHIIWDHILQIESIGRENLETLGLSGMIFDTLLAKKLDFRIISYFVAIYLDRKIITGTLKGESDFIILVTYLAFMGEIEVIFKKNILLDVKTSLQFNTEKDKLSKLLLKVLQSNKAHIFNKIVQDFEKYRDKLTTTKSPFDEEYDSSSENINWIKQNIYNQDKFKHRLQLALKRVENLLQNN